jgi:microcin C transport system permease protein
MPQLNPIARRRWQRFREIRRGYWSAVFLGALIVVSLGAELLVNNRALIVHHQGQWYFPTYGAVLPGTTFGLDYDYETDYKALREKWRASGQDDWVLLPPVPYSPYETDLVANEFPPLAPSLATGH